MHANFHLKVCMQEGYSCFLSGMKILNDQLWDARQDDGNKKKKRKRKNKTRPLYFNPNRPRHMKPRLAGALWYQWLPTTDSLSLQLRAAPALHHALWFPTDARAFPIPACTQPPSGSAFWETQTPLRQPPLEPLQWPGIILQPSFIHFF